MSHLSPESLNALASGAADADAAAHLAGCATCRAAVVDARGRQRLLRGLTPYTLSEVGFRRVEAKLLAAVDEGLPRPPWHGWWVAAGAVAVALLAVLAWPRPERAPAPPVARVVVTPATERALTVVRAAGSARQRLGDGAWQPVSAGARLGEGVALAGGPVVLASADDAGWGFEVQGDAALGGRATLTLGAGTATASLEGAPARVVAGPRAFEGREAVFTVSRAAAEVVVDLSRGELDVFDADSVTAGRRTLKAPVRLRWSDGTPLAAGVEEPSRVGPRLELPKRPWVPMDLSALADGTGLNVDGASVGATPLSLLLGEGRHRLLLTPPGLPAQERFVDLVGGQTFAVAAPSAVGEQDPGREPDQQSLEGLMAELRRQTPKLRACYEKWLKANPTAGGEIVLSLDVSARGRVQRAAVQGAAIPPESVGCLTRTAKTLVLPALGSAQVLELPLVLRPRAK